MTRSSSLLAILLVFGSLGTSWADKVSLPPKENFHLFLLAGQSNMAGRGKVTPEDQKALPRILALSKEGTWVPAVPPIHFDKKSAGVGLSRAFARALTAEDENITIGLIPAACGGSPISTWKPDGYHSQTKSHPYDDAIQRTQRALQDGVLKGILWHQGESDGTPKRAPHYQAALQELVLRFRKDLAAPSVPFIIGQLGQFPSRPWSDSRKLVNAAHLNVAITLPLIGFVSSHQLTPMRDQIHFDARSLQELGRRYADTYLRVTK